MFALRQKWSYSVTGCHTVRAFICLIPCLLVVNPAHAGRGNEAASRTEPDIEVTLVYHHVPDADAAYKRVLGEVIDLVNQGDFSHLRIDARVVTGQEYSERSWRRIADPKGGYIAVDYDPRTKAIRHQGKLLKQL